MRITLSLVILMSLPIIAFSSTIYVPDDHTEIQLAINASSNGDTIIVRPGTYVENIDFIGKTVTLKSEQGAAGTIIDGNQAGSVVSFQSGEGVEARIEGFTLTNGSPSHQGGGIYCNSASPAIVGNVISNNSTDFGAGIYCKSSSATITGNTISDNQVDFNGGGIYCSSGATPTISGNVITGNHADDTAGGIFCFSTSSPTIRGNTISGNTCYRLGGGIYCDTDATIEYNTISDNISYRDGGGILFSNNASAPIIKGNIIANNEASDNGGGIRGSGQGLIVTDNIFAGNRARFKGGGFDSGWSITATLVNNTFVGNSSDYDGGGIYCADYSELVVSNTIFWGNEAPSGPEICIGIPSRPATVTISYSNVYGGQSSCHVDTGCTLNWGAGMMDNAPLFVDPAGGDFHLTWNSPCCNAGDPDVSALSPRDFEGNPRVAFNKVDIGADEFYDRLYHSGDIVPGNTIDLRVIGWPDKLVTIGLSSGVLDPPRPTRYGDLYLAPPVKTFQIDRLPSNGVLNLIVTVPANWNPGEQHPLQALIGGFGWNTTRLSNLLILEVE